MKTPTTWDEYQALKAWAEQPPAAGDAAPDTDIMRHMRFINAALPSKGIDEETGKQKAAVYVTILRGASNDALAYMAREACRTLEWFPTPKQCLELLGQYRGPDDGRSYALRLCSNFAEERLATWLANVANGQPLGDVPERWLRIAVERGTVRRLQDGRFVSRALYFGPYKPMRIDIATHSGAQLEAEED